jgi:hypothetical protein
MSFRFPYLSLDVETTGVNVPKVHVLQLSAVYDNGDSIESLPTFDAVIAWPKILYGEEYAMNLNRHLIERAAMNDNVVTLGKAKADFETWLSQVQPQGKITVAGKNAAGFDLPIFTNQVNGFFFKRFLRRVLDPGSMYTEYFDHIPTLDEINTWIGGEAVTHDALKDAFDVVRAVRYIWKA